MELDISRRLLLASMSAAAQQAAAQPSAQPPAPDATQTAQPAQAGAPTTSQPPHRSRRRPPGAPAPAAAPTTMDQVVNLFIEREHGLIKALSNRTPVVETYLQNLTADPQLGPVPSEDHYFLGRMDMGETVDRKDYLKEAGQEHAEPPAGRLCTSSSRSSTSPWASPGWSMPTAPTSTASTMTFSYVRREFLGDVRCLVFDVTPKKKSGQGRFLGRIWVEDQDSTSCA